MERERESRGLEREGLAAYGMTLVLEVVLCGGARWLLTHGAIVWLQVLLPLGAWVGVLPWLVALVPPVWSLAAFARIGRHGDENFRPDFVHPPDKKEHAELVGAMAELWIFDASVPMPTRVMIAEYPIPGAMVRRDTLFLSRGLLGSRTLPAVLAHELCHLNSVDPWLGVALDRLGRGRDPFPNLRLEELQGPWKLLGVLCLPGRWLLRLAGGGIGRDLLSSRWSEYRMAREFAADAYGASLGQGALAAQYLRAVRPNDSGESRLLDALTFHPPVSERIERLRSAPRPISPDMEWSETAGGEIESGSQG